MALTQAEKEILTAGVAIAFLIGTAAWLVLAINDLLEPNGVSLSGRVP